ncbi:NTP transferase domain-containing protein [Curvibacter sp. HBC61]|uniref:NTP transferase domain-containing protein n=1 Tax=Curvibacter cyanobacteriorum TaxID=3026422 RepID=A0ABT5N4D3_9BURK|nr:NTP transferase domain-containing protein [Curvibacter sp. HBC61]MDD0840913.1 NTP transferase domain-containing protein [Curvibacter sp. HBC61]
MTPSLPSTPRSPVVLVLASGRGERFKASGGQVHKLQALLGGRPVLQRTLAAVQASGLPWHLEDVGHPGMGDSIAAAVRATAQAPGWLVLPADLPLIRPETLRQVAQVLMQGPATVVMPFFEGERGHPVGFAAACGPALQALSGEGGAAPVLRQQAPDQRLSLAVSDAGVVTDIDTLADLARAEALGQQRGDWGPAPGG